MAPDMNALNVDTFDGCVNLKVIYYISDSLVANMDFVDSLPEDCRMEKIYN